MHKEANDYILSVKNRFSNLFINKNILDVGSLDINGNNRIYFENCNYTGLDIGHGKNVDIVCPIHLFDELDSFDMIISTEMLEHDMHWNKSLNRMIDLIHRNGTILITCAGINRAEHGTTRTSPIDSPFTNDYYRNISRKMLLTVFDGKFKTLEIVESDTKEDIYLFATGKKLDKAE